MENQFAAGEFRMLRTTGKAVSGLSFANTEALNLSISDRPIETHPSPRNSKKRFLFVIAHLGPGGAQRVAVNAANALVERGFDVHVTILGHQPIVYWVDPRVTFHSSAPVQTTFSADASSDNEIDQIASVTNDDDEPMQRAGLLATYVKPYLPPRVLAFGLRVAGPIFSVVWQGRRTLWLRRTIRKVNPDAVLSFLTQTNILTVLATRGLATYTVISERNDPRLQRHRARVERLRHIVYPWADVVTANSKGALTALESFVPEHKLAFLPNLLAASPTSETIAFTAPTIITVGRLVEQKGIDVLLSAWVTVVEALPHWRLALVGDGPLAGALKEQARMLGVDNSIDWIGHVSDPFPLLRGAELFVMTSRFEGTPNALLEAMACGLPAVVSDASPGPCELIGTDESPAGLIVPVEDVSATADAIIRLARDQTLRQRFGLAARERVRTHDAGHAIDVWLRLLRCE
jgi:glycosyltransferase involved in cell wall biosynthesis